MKEGVTVTGTDFYANVEKHPQLTWLGVHPETEEVVVKDTYLGIKHALTLDSITESRWSDLCDIMTGKRDGKIMRHISRIVGYVSRHENWNPSKLAELAERHKGNYAVAS